MMGEVAPGKIAAKEVDTKKLMRRYCLLPLPISKPCLEINLNVLNIQPSFFSMCKLSSGQISSSLLGKPSKEKTGKILVFYQYWGGEGTPRPIYFRFFPKEKTFIA